MVQKPSYEELELRLKKLEQRFKSAERAIRNARDAKRNYKRFLQFLPYPVIVKSASGIVTYLNPAFTKTFGWQPKELKGRSEDLCIPDPLKSELPEKIEKLGNGKTELQFATKRMTKDGKVLDVRVRIGIEMEDDHNPGEMIIVLKDETMEKRNRRNRRAMTRISQALPRYPVLRELLYYINTEIRELLHVKGSNVMLLDKSRKQFYFLSAAYDDPSTRERIQKVKFSTDELLSGQVIKTGEPMIVNNFSDDHLHQYRLRDQKLGYEIKNVILVPLRVKDRVIGVLAADNKKTGGFDNTDLETLSTLAATVALSIENARVSRELKKAYDELKSISQAKDKMISHLSHELKTPVAVLLSSFKILSNKLSELPENTWRPTMERIKRNLDRIIGIEDEVYDIVEQKEIIHEKMFSVIFDQCQDLIESLIAEETGETEIISKVREAIESTFAAGDPAPENINLGLFVKTRLEKIRPDMAHRKIEFVSLIESGSIIEIPEDPLRKTVDGLIKNAVENSPDGKKIEIHVRDKGDQVLFQVKDFGTGLTEEAQKRVFEGFFATQSTMNYSSKNAFDFNAGGKGADLLRMKIFSEKFGFDISMQSKRCSSIPENQDTCPGSAEQCTQMGLGKCDGTTTVTCSFPAKM